MTASAPSDAPATRLDPDALAGLEDERDHLLASLDDLDAEYQAGDLTDEEHRSLHDEYTARAAEVIHAIDEHRVAMSSVPRRRSAARVAIAVVAVIAVASVAGWLLARSTGARGSGTGLTGSAGSVRERLAECQRLFGEPDDAVDCYDDILADQPDQLEALTYQGWALVRGDRSDEAMTRFDRVVELDPTYPDVFVFRAVVKKNAGAFPAAQAELDRLYALDPPASLLDTMQSMGLDVEVLLGLLGPELASCWKDVAKFGTDLQQASTTVPAGATPDGFAEALACFDPILAANPDDLNALTFRAAAVYGIGATEYVQSALDGLDRAIAAHPDDPTARVVRAGLRVRNGNVGGTAEDVGILRSLGRPSVLVGGIEAALQRDVAALVGPTSTTVP